MQFTNKSIKQLPKVILPNTDLQVSRLGLGCMGMSVFYATNPVPEEESIKLIGQAIDQGINFFDTAALYGDNELLLAKAIKKYGRDKFVIATKVPPFIYDEKKEIQQIPGTPENIKKYCQKSLERLEISQIDLFYQHRIDKNIPIETQAQAFKDLIQEGKIRYYGLSEASENTIRRAHKIHPVTAVQEEYSLFTRDVEQNGVFKACKELNIALVPYSPLGRGLLTGSINSQSDLSQSDHRASTMPRFQEEALKKNNEKVHKLQEFSEQINATSSQVALAWLLAQGSNIFPIPGTKREKYLTSNNQSAFIQLDSEQLRFLDELFPFGSTEGSRYPEFLSGVLNSDTVPL